LRLFKIGLFWHILTPIGISKKKFLRKKSAQKFMDMQDKHGIRIRKEKKWR